MPSLQGTLYTGIALVEAEEGAHLAVVYIVYYIGGGGAEKQHPTADIS